ncbi:MAG TPA: ABC transporter ATP-binding protein [Burkholderiaceae bacterium]|jgi:branched-chain amino acid transport system ATP-binding protein|nr:ABC transporter ATP-binding protein [Burkholderiaceae bacterium]HMN65400.1 ABC transporter ATP-binding protein [Burkholderiaceae bacterium]
MAEPLIEITDLHAYYGASHVLRGVSLRIDAGEALGLLGRNGMGKTTLIRGMLRLMRATTGRIVVRGRDCSAERPDRVARLGIGYVPEGRGIFPNLSVRENLLMASRPGLRGQTDWTLERVLQTFPRLTERLHHGGNQLSGGEQQMLAIGRALMTNPDLIVLDEATEGLAPLIVREIWGIVAGIRASGIASLVVDRNYRAVLAHTDRCVVLERGQVALEGSSSALAGDERALQAYLGV